MFSQPLARKRGHPGLLPVDPNRTAPAARRGLANGADGAHHRGMSTALDSDGIDTVLAELPGWTHDPSIPALVLEYKAPSFPEAVEWVRAVAQVAEHNNHHPDIDIRYRTVTFRCATHSEGAVTNLDAELASAISRLAPE